MFFWMDLLGSHRALLFSAAPLPPKNIYLFTIIKFGGKVRILWSIIPNHKKFALKKRNGVRWTISFQMASTTSRARSSTQQHILLHTYLVKNIFQNIFFQFLKNIFTKNICNTQVLYHFGIVRTNATTWL